MAILHVGQNDWPFPVPIVREADGWRFDTASGKEELLNRRIGRNEITVIRVCRAYVDAQKAVRRVSHVYAQSFRKHAGQARRPLLGGERSRRSARSGPLVASATAEGYHQAEAG